MCVVVWEYTKKYTKRARNKHLLPFIYFYSFLLFFSSTHRIYTYNVVVRVGTWWMVCGRRERINCCWKVIQWMNEWRATEYKTFSPCMYLWVFHRNFCIGPPFFTLIDWIINNRCRKIKCANSIMLQMK